MIGRTLGGRYALVRLIGEGGMGAVYEAKHTGTGRRVAIKQMTRDFVKDKTLRARFENEARAAGQLETQHVVQVLDVGEDEHGAPFIVMEHLTGEDLSHLCKRLGPLPIDLALRIGLQACLGLEKAHAAGIIHRDIKPANIFMAERDNGEVVVKLLDFGIAKVNAPDASSGGTLTRSGNLLGSPQYMSPEQARGTRKLDARSDIWSLGVALYRMLAGATPYQHIEAMGELIITLCSGPPPPVQSVAPWIPLEVAQVVERALALEPSDRYASATELASALRALLPGGTQIDRAMLAAISDDARTSVGTKTPRALAAEAAGHTTRRILSDGELASATTLPERHPADGVAATSQREMSTRPEAGIRAVAKPARRNVWPWLIASAGLGAVTAFFVFQQHSPHSDATKPALAGPSTIVVAPSGAASQMPVAAKDTSSAAEPLVLPVTAVPSAPSPAPSALPAATAIASSTATLAPSGSPKRPGASATATTSAATGAIAPKSTGAAPAVTAPPNTNNVWDRE